MKLFVSTKETQGYRESDYSFVPEGEFVLFGFECDRDKSNIDGGCGCRRGMVGLTSHKATTTFKVQELVISQRSYTNGIRKHYEDGGWLKFRDDEFIKDQVKELTELADSFPVGVVLEKRGDVIQVRKKK